MHTVVRGVYKITGRSKKNKNRGQGELVRRFTREFDSSSCGRLAILLFRLFFITACAAACVLMLRGTAVLLFIRGTRRTTTVGQTCLRGLCHVQYRMSLQPVQSFASAALHTEEMLECDIIITNPPYGRTLKEKSTLQLVKEGGVYRRQLSFSV